MNKEEFLKSLTEEQLHLLDSIAHTNIIDELNRRNSEVKVGDCFIYKQDCNNIFLAKIMSIISDEPNYFDCKEINIYNDEIDTYKINYHIDDINEYDRIDSEIFNKIITLINNKNNTLNKIYKEFENQIREICMTLLNTPNKH